jgi:hypothetical protein
VLASSQASDIIAAVLLPSLFLLFFYYWQSYALPFSHKCSFDTFNRQQTILKSNLILTDDHPGWSLTLKNDNTQRVESSKGLRYIGGVDLSFIVGNNEDAIASLIILTYPDFKVNFRGFFSTFLSINERTQHGPSVNSQKQCKQLKLLHSQLYVY